MNFTEKYFENIKEIAGAIDFKTIEGIVNELIELRVREGRLFIIGVGGGAANASHAVNDFRKLCGIEAYSPVDNVSELTARTNDEGWETVFERWLITSKANRKDALLVFSVGGGDIERNISANIVHALMLAKKRYMKIFGVVGRDGGYTKTIGDYVVVVPTVNRECITPHTESFQAVVWHCIVFHPRLRVTEGKWESEEQK